MENLNFPLMVLAGVIGAFIGMWLARRSKNGSGDSGPGGDDQAD